MKFLTKYLNAFPEAGAYIYRGHGNRSWELKPSIGRHFTGNWAEIVNYEKEAMEVFKKKAHPYLKFTPKVEIDWLCLMQHHGCATRLLDFTSNPLVALFFASDPNFDADGAVYITSFGKAYENVIEENLSVFEIGQPFVYYPPHITERIIGQQGCFLFSSIPNKPFKEESFLDIRVLKEEKKYLRADLYRAGICHASIFPGLDGLSKDINDKLTFDLEILGLF